MFSIPSFTTFGDQQIFLEIAVDLTMSTVMVKNVFEVKHLSAAL